MFRLLLAEYERNRLSAISAPFRGQPGGFIGVARRIRQRGHRFAAVLETLEGRLQRIPDGARCRALAAALPAAVRRHLSVPEQLTSRAEPFSSVLAVCDHRLTDLEVDAVLDAAALFIDSSIS